jgi:hypothetical protein
MLVPTEHITDERLFGQRDVTLREGFEEMESELAESPQEPLDSGRSFPLGATVTGDGVNFSVFSRQASRVDLLLFNNASATHPARVIELDPRTHRTYHYWHVLVPGIRPGQITRIVPTAPSIRSAVYGSIPPRCSSIPTDAVSSCPRDTLARQRANTHGLMRSQ